MFFLFKFNFIKWKIFSHYLSPLFILLSMIFNSNEWVSIIFQYDLFRTRQKYSCETRFADSSGSSSQDNPSMLNIKYEDWRYAIRRLLGYFLLDQQFPPSFTSPFTIRIDTRSRVCFANDNTSLHRQPLMAIVAPVVNNYRPILLSTSIERIKVYVRANSRLWTRFPTDLSIKIQLFSLFA